MIGSVSYSLQNLRRDLSACCLTALLAGCTEQGNISSSPSNMQFDVNPEKAAIPLTDSVFDSPSSISR